jgi:hypothetical protein
MVEWKAAGFQITKRKRTFGRPTFVPILLDTNVYLFAMRSEEGNAF